MNMASNQSGTVQKSIKEYTSKRDVNALSPEASFDDIENKNRGKKNKVDLEGNMIDVSSQSDESDYDVPSDDIKETRLMNKIAIMLKGFGLDTLKDNLAEMKEEITVLKQLSNAVSVTKNDITTLKQLTSKMTDIKSSLNFTEEKCERATKKQKRQLLHHIN